MNSPTRPLPRLSMWLVVLLILAATWVRWWRLPQVPPAFNYDEAYNAVDSLWLWKAGALTPFLPGNTGRQTLFHYLAAFAMALLGVNTFALRFVSAVAGILTVPLIYCWVVTMFADEPQRRWLGLMAGAGVAFSFWHIALSRSGFRASVMLFLLALTLTLFWRGWQRRSLWYVVGAGVALGLSQYTYWLAVLFPLLFGLSALAWTITALRKSPSSLPAKTHSVKQIWLWMGVMAASSFVVFIPLGLHYLNTPSVLSYVAQSSAASKFPVGQQATWPHRLVTSIRVFVDGPLALWQGQLAQSLSFDWLALLGFWIGLAAAIKRLRYPAYSFLLIGLVVLWLPAPLNDIDFSDLRLLDMLPVHHAISNLRLAGVLPVYYVFVAIGLLAGAKWLGQKLLRFNQTTVVGIVATVFLIVSGVLNTHSFFVQWPRQPLLYERYNGPIFDLAQELFRQSQDKDILIPLHLYAHPTMHFFFDGIFSESDAPPLDDSHRSAILVTTSNSPSSAYMWLVRPGTGTGTAYLTPVQNSDDLLGQSSAETAQTFNLAAPLHFAARLTLIPDMETVRPQLIDWPALGQVNYTWNDEVRLVGYQVTPRWAQPGESVGLILYWQNLVDQPFPHDVFIHIVDGHGRGVGQVDGVTLGDDHRWRAGRLTPTYHTLQLGDQIGTGPHLIRLGLFSAVSGDRVPVFNAGGEHLGDQVLLGLFYVVEDGADPTRPAVPIQATLGRQIRLLGYTPPSDSLALRPEGETTLSLKIYWGASQPVDGDYTIFVQLLDSQNRLITGYDTRPVNGTYPTFLWQTEEVIVEAIDLSLPAQMEPGEYRLVTGMYDFATGQRLAATDSHGLPLGDNMVELSKVSVSAGQAIFVQ